MRVLPLLLALPGCVGATGGERIAFEAVVEPVAPVSGGAVAWTDEASGFEIVLTEASLAAGPVYLWSDESLVDVGVSALRRVVMPVGAVGTDQFVAGFLTGEVTTQRRVDLLGGVAVPFGPGSGLAGPSRTAEVWLEPVADGTSTVHARGVATRGELVVPFRLDATFDEAWAPEGADITVLRRVRGLSWDVELTDGGTLTVGVDVRRWFDDVAFETLPAEVEADDDGAFAIGPDTSVGPTVFRDLRRLSADGPWSLSFTP